MKNLLTRALTGVVYVALIVLGVLLSDLSMVLLCCVLAAVAVNEFVCITGHATRATAVIDVLGALCVVCAGAHGTYTDMFIGLFVVYVILRLVMTVYASRRDTPVSAAYSFMSVLYIALPLCMLCSVRTSLPEGRWLVLGMFVMIWLNDTGAYLVGSAIGRHKLLERVSPKKSVEGFVGGVVFAVSAAPLFYYCFPEQFGKFSLVMLCAVGLSAGIVGTLGDLVESRLKRSLGVKDSGNILPGHGGILDRIDSLLLVAPVVWLLMF